MLFKIPHVIYKISTLETLWLRYNRITAIDEQISQLQVRVVHEICFILFETLLRRFLETENVGYARK